MQVRYQLRHRPNLWVVTAVAATLRCYYISGQAMTTRYSVAAGAVLSIGTTGQSFHSRSRP